MTKFKDAIQLIRSASNETPHQISELGRLGMKYGEEFSYVSYVSCAPDFIQACNYAEKLTKRFNMRFGVIGTQILLVEDYKNFEDGEETYYSGHSDLDFVSEPASATSSTPNEIEFRNNIDAIADAVQLDSIEDAALAIESAFRDNNELSRQALVEELKLMKEGKAKDEYMVNENDQARHHILQRQVGKEYAPEFEKALALEPEQWRAFAKKGLLQCGSMKWAVELGKQRVTMTGKHGEQMKRYGIKRPEFVLIAKHRTRKDWWVLDERMPSTHALKKWEPMEIIWWAGHPNHRKAKVTELKRHGMYFEDGFTKSGASYLRKEEDAFYRQPISAQVAELPRYHVEILDKSTGEMIGKTVYANSGASAEKKVRKVLIDAGLYHCETQEVRQADADSLSSVNIDLLENLVTDDYETEADLSEYGLDLFDSESSPREPVVRLS